MDGSPPSPDRIAALLEAISGVRLLCLGDVMLDRFVHGRVERTSPEAPIPVLAIAGEAELPGGAANVARNAAALGASVALLGAIGEDAAGQALQRLAQASGADASLVAEPGRPTTVKTRFLAGVHQLLRADQESVRPISDAAVARLRAAAEKEMARADAVVLSDYGKGVLAGSLARELIGRARAAGRFVAVDPRGDWARYRGADLLTPNRRELAEASGEALNGLGAVEAAARRLLRAHGLGAVLVTLSEQGMLLVEERGARHLSAAAREVFDVSGAGDTVIAVLAATVGAGAGLAEAAQLANAAAGIVVGKLGPAVAAPREILAALEQDGRREKTLSLADALEQVRRWRLQGLRIGFTNGCFDLLHPGHADLLAFARAGCDRLVVALNDDASVRRLKGSSRPVQPLSSRAAVLAAMAAVDLVVPFAEDTPIALIEAIRPDLLVKGADYREEDVVGAAEVRAYGGEVRLAPVKPGHSTSATLARLRSATTA